MKLPRTNKDYGGGSGRTFFTSELFSVGWMRWSKDQNITTTITLEGCDIEITFDGQHDIKSDKKCFEQLTVAEIKKLISSRESQAFERGRRDKASEIHKCLYIR